MSAKLIKAGAGWRADCCTLCGNVRRAMGNRHADFQEGTCANCNAQWPKFYTFARAEAYYAPRIRNYVSPQPIKSPRDMSDAELVAELTPRGWEPDARFAACDPCAEQNHSYLTPPHAAHPANVAAQMKRQRIEFPI